MAERESDQFTEKIHFLAAVLMVCMLFIPGFLTLVDIANGPGTARQESIARTPKIEPSFQNLARFLGDFRFYVKERFGLKENLVTLNSAIKEALFEISPYNKVIRGGDGFLFLGVAEAIDFTQGVSLFTEEELDRWAVSVTRNAEKVGKLGSKYELVLTPNKHSIYPEKLPDWVKSGRVKKTRSDQLLDKLRSFGFSAHDLRVPLERRREVSEVPILYYKTDTHWNEFGASLGVRYFLSEIGLGVYTDNQPERIIADKGGDLARMIGQQYQLEEIAWSTGNFGTVSCRYTDDSGFVRNQTDPLHFEQLECENSAASAVSAVVFMDSFGVSMIPAFANAFRNVIFLWQYELDDAVIERFKPDFVVHQITERKLQTLDPESL